MTRWSLESNRCANDPEPGRISLAQPRQPGARRKSVVDRVNFGALREGPLSIGVAWYRRRIRCFLGFGSVDMVADRHTVTHYALSTADIVNAYTTHLGTLLATFSTGLERDHSISFSGRRS